MEQFTQDQTSADMTATPSQRMNTIQDISYTNNRIPQRNLKKR